MVSNTLVVWPVWFSHPGSVPFWIFVKINPMPTEPRTPSMPENLSYIAELRYDFQNKGYNFANSF